MPDSIHFFAYASSASRAFTAEDLAALLAVSRANNVRDGLTGMLLYRGGNFLQAIEGPEKAIRATMKRISLDHRHRSIALLYDEVQSERVFGEWSMGFTDADKLDPARHPGLNQYLSRANGATLIAADTEHDVFEFFTSFRTYVT